ncbi:MAG: ABC-F family ATP-binding cassette domain-containing protein [Eubacterium sp.]|nr:ABC-F family ATP-binding cassette domain-containing protein [Eubacterium sp.]
MIISLNSVSKAFGETEVLKNITFLLNEKEKAAVVGINGCGKTTLFKLITGELTPTGGDIIIPKFTEIGYFSQSLTIDSESTIYSELMGVFKKTLQIEKQKQEVETQLKNAKGEDLDRLLAKYDRLSEEFEKRNGFESESRVKGVIKGLGFSEEDSERKINTLSGGQKTRVALGRLLLASPDLLLLDEPTNHLDIDSIKWLEGYLSAYKGTVIIISHDRFFIDKTTNKIIEIENGVSRVFSGSYEEYAQKKQILRETELHHYINNQREIKRQQQSIEKLKSFNREKSIKRAESKEKALEKFEKLKSPDPVPEGINLRLTPAKTSGKDVLTLTDISKSFGENCLFKGLDLEIKKGDKVALIGANGTGKTTLFKIITGGLSPDSGSVRIGSNVEIGYYDQEQENLNKSKTLFDEIHDENPEMTTTEVRSLLAALLFKGDDADKQISLLSGGEKGRASLAKLCLSKANFLLLDEPTNHLDICSKDLLDQALSEYSGTILFISHDRYFINKTANKIIELKDGKLQTYLGNYDYYEEKQSELPQETVAVEQSNSAGKNDWQKQKEQLSLQRKAQARQKRLEKEAADLEAEIDSLEVLLETAEVATDPKKAADVYNEKTELEEKLLLVYDELES